MGGDSPRKALPVHGRFYMDREERGRDQVILGDKMAIEEEIASHIISSLATIRVVHAIGRRIIDMHDQPATRSAKSDSSMVKRYSHDPRWSRCLVSCRSTGAQIRQPADTRANKGVSRPAIGAFLPRERRCFADRWVRMADCKPINLLQFGIMGGIWICHHPR